MEFDDAIIGALVEHEKFGRGIVLSHRDPSFGLLTSNEILCCTVHIHWPDAEGHWKNTPERYERKGGHYKFYKNYFGDIRILSMPNLRDSTETFE